MGARAQPFDDEVELMGVRFPSCVLFAALCLCALPPRALAQEANVQAGANVSSDDMALDDAVDSSGAMIPPELAFASDSDITADEAEASDVALLSGTGLADDAAELSARAFYDRYRRFNTTSGPTGGLHLVDPSSGKPGSFRIQLGTDFFSSSDYLHNGDDVDSTRYALAMTWTATDEIEVFGSLSSRASNYELPEASASGSNRSQSLQATGDLSFGLKVGGYISGPFSLGGDVRVLLGSGEGKATPELAATSMSLRASAALDLRQQTDPIPFIARFNLGYLIDNSAKIVEAREAARYGQINNARPIADETRQLANRFERLAFGINRVDMLSIGLGVELPLFIADDFYLHPMVEWNWGIPVNRQAYDCAHLALTGAGSADDFEDSCLQDESLAAAPMTLSLGLRVVTPLRGFSAFAGVDIGLTGTSTFVRELAPNAPYAVLLGIAVDYDARPAPVQIVEREVVVQAPAEAVITGRVAGTVVDQNQGSGVAQASVQLLGRDLSALRTDDDGRFTSFDLPPGEVRYRVTHPDYESGECVAVISADGGVAVSRCAIAALPRKGTLKLRLVDVWGAPVAGASVRVNGPVVLSLNANAEGVVRSDELAAGQYSVVVDAPNHYLRATNVEITARQTQNLDLTLAPRAGASRAQLRGTEVKLSGTVRFARGSVEIDATLAPAIADVADLLLRNPQLTQVRIEGPVDAGAATDATLALGRALAIKQRLVDSGVDASRLNAIAGTTSRLKVTAE